MKLDKVKLLEETPEHYRLEDERGPFRVAKKGLGKGTLDRIAQHFAAGGQVMQMPEMVMAIPPAPEFTYSLPSTGEPITGVPPPPPPIRANLSDYFGAPPSGDIAGYSFDPNQPMPTQAPSAPPRSPESVTLPVPGRNQGIKVPVSQLTSEQRIQYGFDSPQAAPTPDPAPAAPPPAPVQPAAGGMPSMSPPPSSGGAGIGAAENAQIAAAKQQAAVAAHQADQEAQVMEAQEQRMAGLRAVRDNQMAAHQARGDELFNAVRDSKIDPKHLWNSAGTGQKVGSIIGIILSGIGQGLAGGENAALKVLDKAIDQDIEAQRENLETKKGLLSQHMQAGRDMDSAYQLAKADQLDAAAASLQKVAAKNGSERAQANALMQVGQIRAQAAGLRQQASAQDFERWYKTQSLALEGAKIAASARAPDKDQAKALAEVEDRYQSIRANIGKTKGLIVKGGTWDAMGSHNQILNQQLEAIATDMAKLSDPQSIARPSEVEAAKALLFQPSFWAKNSTAQDALDNFMSLAQQRRDIMYRNRGMGASAGPPSLRQGRE